MMDKSNHITYFAETDARSKRVKFGIKDEDRLRHIYSIGKTGMGKSTMLENMAIQDIQNGNGMAFLDPHGKTADLLLDYIPEHRLKDVIYFAPFDIDFPISFNVMEDVGPDRRHLVVSGLMSAFEKIWADAWSARMAYILQNTLAALLEFPGATLLGVNRMYTDKEYRNKVIENVTDPTIKSFWTEEYAKYTDRYTQEATPAIQNKIGQFTANPLIRNIIGQPGSSFDMRKIMDEKKILIVNLSKGLVGENNANLLGSMLVTKIYLAAMSRSDANPREMAKLPNFYLYVDEFQSFANKSFADILSEARKYGLSLNITHQYIEQMPEEVRAAVFGNVGTMITFRVGSFDAEILEKEFAPVFTMEDIVNLGFVQIYLKLMIEGVASSPFSATTLPPIPKPTNSFRETVLNMSRQNFANPKADVEKKIKEWHLPEQRSESRIKNQPISPAGRESRLEKRMEPKKEEPRVEIKIETKKPEIKIEKPKFEPREEKNNKNTLANAIEEAMKGRPHPSPLLRPDDPFGRVVKGRENKDEEKKEAKPISLGELKKDEKNKNKEATPENKNALKEALQKVARIQPPESRKEEIKTKNTTREVPEDVLRGILKGK